MSEFGVRPCEYEVNGQRCSDLKTRRYDMQDGGDVWLCIRHRSWLPALASVKANIQQHRQVLNRLESHLGCVVCRGPLTDGVCPTCE